MARAAFKTVAVAAARAADEKKGERIVLLHVAKTSPITDYLLIVTATSRPHLETLEHEIERAAVREGMALRDVAHLATVDEAVADLRSHLLPGDVVLIKASRVAGLERVADAIRGDAP